STRGSAKMRRARWTACVIGRRSIAVADEPSPPVQSPPAKSDHCNARRRGEDRVKIGVILPLDTGPGVADGPRYADIRALAIQAEQSGFDSVWVFDHLLYRFPDQPTMGVWEAWTTLSALAEATTTVELGTLVLCAPFRNPALLAKMASALDEISGGRLILGLGSGWHEPELKAFGMPTDRLASRFAEALAIVAPLLRTGAVDFQGEYYQAVDCVD